MPTPETLFKTESGVWELVVGLEVHVQVTSQSKLFSGAAVTFAAAPNSQVSPIDAGMPGMLPVLNKFCVKQAVKTGLALNAKINPMSRFDRKNYFYADLPQGYQISQFYHPIVGEGYLDIDLDDGGTKRIGIERLHLEQDAGKSIHDLDPESSFIDLNRCGTTLMEIVTKPDMHNAREVMDFLKKLRLILRYLETSDGNMDEGSMRADVNVSVRRPGAPLGVRVEIKNVNSIRFVGKAISFEMNRQISLIESGHKIAQETRLYDPGAGETRSMRDKEDAQDYRYFPDPDLLPIRLDQSYIEDIRAHLPELPDQKKRRFIQEYGVTPYDASVLVSDMETSDFYEETVQSTQDWRGGHQNISVSKLTSNWLISEVFSMLKKERKGICSSHVTACQLAGLIDLIQEHVISGRIAKDVFQEMWKTHDNPEKIVQDKRLVQITDSTTLESIIDTILSEKTNMVQQYKSGKEKIFGFFVGQVMKETQGKANPKLVNDLLKDKLK